MGMHYEFLGEWFVAERPFDILYVAGTLGKNTAGYR